MTARKNKKQKQIKRETVEEYLARGGKVERLPYIEPSYNSGYNKIHAPTPLPPHQMSIDEGAHYFAERKKSKKKADYSGIDMDLIPEDLKKSLGVT